MATPKTVSASMVIRATHITRTSLASFLNGRRQDARNNNPRKQGREEPDTQV
ncbi:MAG: hypothetical protein LBD96_00605 [Treponema sp.]|nr:hypothetical protein [Treponema sp.]